MLLSYFYLSIVFLFFTISCTSPLEHHGRWSWDNAKHLTRANWTSSLKANTNSSKINHSVWFIYYYLNYCGFCKRFKPNWESVGQYAAGWSRYIKIGAYDCASEAATESDICHDRGYPQWRIYCPLMNSTQLAFDSDRRTIDTKPEDILIWSLKKMDKIAHQCYGKSWPIRDAIQPQTIDDLNKIIPKRTKKFQLIVTDDRLHYALYVLNNSKSVSHEPIYRLATQNSILQDVGIWEGTKDDNGQISLRRIDSTNAVDKVILAKNIINDTDKTTEKKIGSLKPTLTDIDSSVTWMIKKDLHRKLPATFEAIKAWVHVLHTYYPGSETMNNFLANFIEFMNNQTDLTSHEFKNYIHLLSTIPLPDIKFDHCNGSDPSKRGYTCSLWILFHSMTVKQAILAEQNKLSPNVKPADLFMSIREFVRNFFLCEECVHNFLTRTENAENEITSFKESVLYLWRAHNKANKHLKGEVISNDPAWPKLQFPTKEQCPTCIIHVDEDDEVVEYDENETYNFLKDFYNLQNLSFQKTIVTKTNTAMKWQFNHLYLLLLSLFLFKLVPNF